MGVREREKERNSQSKWEKERESNRERDTKNMIVRARVRDRESKINRIRKKEPRKLFFIGWCHTQFDNDIYFVKNTRRRILINKINFLTPYSLFAIVLLGIGQFGLFRFVYLVVSSQ